MEYLELHTDELNSFIHEKNPVVVDMRDAISYKSARISGAVPADDSTIRQILKNKNRPVLVYCYHGISSRELAGMLSSMGVREVYNLTGGWQAVAARTEQNPLTGASYEN